MPSIELQRNMKFIKKMWRSYFLFMIFFSFIRRPYAKIFWLLVASVLLVAVLIKIPLLFSVGLTLFYLGLAYIIWHLLKWFLYYQRLMRYYRHPENVSKSFVYSYDDEGIHYRFKDMNVDFLWSRFTSYTEFREHIFLFAADRRLIEIVAKNYIGEQHYKAMSFIIKEKLKELSVKY